jgi:hypothetical protein
VQKVNQEGHWMNIRGVVPLEADSLIRSAIATTGLSDFGTTEWEEPFRVLTRALDDEAKLNLIGRIRTRSELLQLLEARLQIEDVYRLHPEIEQEVIKQPLIVVGQSRSGTSFLHNILWQDPAHGVLKHWEEVFPCPPPEAATYLTDPRIERAHHLITQCNRITPTMASMHEFAADLPMECCVVLGMSFMSQSWFDSMGQVPTYDAFLARQDLIPAYEYHRRVLKLLQWRNPRKRWVLKDPTHLDRIESLFTVYPDALIVWPHRDPSVAMSSVVSLVGTVQWGRTDYPFNNSSFEFVLDPFAAARRLEVFIGKIDSGIVPANQLFNVTYSNLLRDPLGVVRALYTHFSLELTPEAVAAMDRFLTANPRDARPKHAKSTANSAELAADRAAFARYREYFQIEPEGDD